MTSKLNYIPTTEKKSHVLAARVNIADETGAFVSEIDIHKEFQNVWNQLQLCQHNVSDLRAQWLESITRYKASVKGDADAAKTVKTMIKISTHQQMHHKLLYITKGSRSGSLTQPTLNPKSTFICTTH